MESQQKKISSEEYHRRQQETPTQQEYKQPQYPKSRGGKRHKTTKEIVEIKRILKLDNNQKLQKKFREKLEESKGTRANLKRQRKNNKKQALTSSTQEKKITPIKHRQLQK